jgi:monoamine oxidase
MEENRKKVVVIVGAGMAGIGAARWLIDNDLHQSLEVIVLEARDRVGGRIHTNFDFDCPVDLGAAWLHNHCGDNPISMMSSHLNLKIKKSDDESGEVYDLSGKQYGDLQTMRTWELMEKVLSKSVKSVQGNFENESLEDIIFSKVTPKQWNDPVFQSWFAILDFELGTPISEVSPAAICPDWIRAMDGDEEDINMVFYETGYVGIINALLTGRATDHPFFKPQIPNELLDSDRKPPRLTPMNIRLNHCVESITHSPLDQFPIVLSVRDTTDGSLQTIEADRVLVTVPLGVLKSNAIRFSPPLSPQKEFAIHRAGYGNVVKIVLEFTKIFWSPKAEFLSIADPSLCSPHPSTNPNTDTGSQNPPQLRGLCTHFWNLFPFNGKKVLVCFGLGDAAAIIDKMSDEELMELLLSRLKCLEKHSKLKTKFKQVTAETEREFRLRYQPIRWMRTRWADDPYSCGAYSFVSKGLSNEAAYAMWEELGRPESEHLWFAGEATMTSSETRSSVHGAWLSGVRAAERIGISLSQPIYTPGYHSFPFPTFSCNS